MTNQEAVRLSVSPRIGMPVYVQLKEQIRHLIAVGELGPGIQLPPADRLADNLPINRHTVLTAYRALAQRGYVESRNGVGSFVAASPRAVQGGALPPDLLARLDGVLRAAPRHGVSPEQIAYLCLTRRAGGGRGRREERSETSAIESLNGTAGRSHRACQHHAGHAAVSSGRPRSWPAAAPRCR
jgi:DNA-binding transcriptional regulator YhcF (GntR family)